MSEDMSAYVSQVINNLNLFSEGKMGQGAVPRCGSEHRWWSCGVQGTDLCPHWGATREAESGLQGSHTEGRWLGQL